MENLLDRQTVVGHDAAIFFLVGRGVQKHNVVGERVKIVNLTLGEAADGHNAVQRQFVVFYKVVLFVAKQHHRGPALFKAGLIQQVFQQHVVNVFQQLLGFKHLGNADALFGIFGLRPVAGVLRDFDRLIALLNRPIPQFPGRVQYPLTGLFRNAEGGVLIQNPGRGGRRYAQGPQCLSVSPW